MPAIDALTPCPQCDREARVVGGLCSNCGVLRGEWPPTVPTRRPVVALFDSEDDRMLVLAVVPGVVLVVLGLLWLGDWVTILGALWILGCAGLLGRGHGWFG